MLFHRLYVLISNYEETTFAMLGISPREYAVLRGMEQLNSPITATGVAHWLNRNINTVTMIVNRLIKQGLISRTRDMRNRRSLRLSLTPEGERLLTEANNLADGVAEKVLSDLSTSDLETLFKTMRRVESQLSLYRTSEQISRPDAV